MFETRMTVMIKTDLPAEHRGIDRVIPAGQTVTVTAVSDNVWAVTEYKALGTRTYVTAADLHKHTTHPHDIGNTCDSCNGAGEHVTRYSAGHQVATPCKGCKGKGRKGRTYKANV